WRLTYSQKHEVPQIGSTHLQPARSQLPSTALLAAAGAASTQGRIAHEKAGALRPVDPLDLRAVAVREALRVDRDLQARRLRHRVRIFGVLGERQAIHERAAGSSGDVEAEERTLRIIRAEILKVQGAPGRD